jgi:hypothetical protein
MRASAFAYGMLQELRAQGAITGTPNGILDSVRLVSGVVGGVGHGGAVRVVRPQGVGWVSLAVLDHQCQKIHGQFGA